ncbi:DUF4972 domain-containing protein [Olivibacter ginsenosidimutans]|uniref:DUF4972 domain-containing protein n=1 Tax=Olivibacter ginsenosidimutans TaxID=1176537 RepID=A0ABP9BQQ8_9SPHI
MQRHVMEFMKSFRSLRVALVICHICLGAALVSCAKDSDNRTTIEPVTDKTDIYLDRLEQLRGELNSLLEGAVFGDKKGDYPFSSKTSLEEQIAYLTNTITGLQAGSKKLLASDLDRMILDTKAIAEQFTSSVRTVDFLALPAELQVNGAAGGYIDFGAHPEYSAFGESGKQAFTIDFWVKLADVDHLSTGFTSLLSTFTDDDTNDHERKGWFVNNFFGKLRMSYGISFNDLFEPGVDFKPSADRWVHIAIVTNEAGVDGAMNGDIPVMTKIYINGVLALAEKGRDDQLPYTPNGKDIPMVAFTQLSAKGERLGDKGINGRLKHLHLWKSAKTLQEIQTIMNNPETVTGSENDLVCGWTLDKTVSDHQHIADLTGKYEAKLMGDYQWIEP